MQSFEDLYRENGNTVYKFLLAKTNNPDIAEDLTQETFYQALKRIDKYDNSCKISTWLCAIAKNLLYEYYRKNPVNEDLDSVNSETESAESLALTSINKVELMKSLHSLEDPYREVMYLRIFGNLSFKEIGEITGKSENFARVTFYRAKEKLRKEIGRDE